MPALSVTSQSPYTPVNGMITITGTATAGMTVEIIAGGNTFSTTAGPDGKWSIQIPADTPTPAQVKTGDGKEIQDLPISTVQSFPDPDQDQDEESLGTSADKGLSRK